VRAGEESLELAAGVGDHATVAHALLELGWAAHMQQDHSLAVAYGERAVVEASLVGDRHLRFRSAGQLGVFLGGAGRFVDARPVLQEAVDGFRELGDHTNEAIELCDLGTIDYRLGDYERALVQFETAVEMCRTLGHKGGLGDGLACSAYTFLALGRRREARERALEALELATELAQTRVATYALAVTALASAEVDPERAAQLLGATEELRRRNGFVLTSDDVELERLESDRVVTALGNEAFALAYTAGAALSLVDATQLAQELAALAVD
jgi:tetratricopeptide (TPR) repeat protein